MFKKPIFLIALPVVAIAAAGLFLYVSNHGSRNGPRTDLIYNWFRDQSTLSEYWMSSGVLCGDAPFMFPTNGLVGFIWDDSFRPGHRHSGLDIFSGTAPGVTPIAAAYPGYLTRQPDWVSTVIIRVPQDPLEPARQIWVYYTHMADANGNSFVAPEFPQGTSEVFVEAGTFLGYQGNYSGDPNSPVGVHLHISIVKDDGFGNFLNELDIENTYDPSPYFGMPLNANTNTDTIPFCR
ncbi:MAG: hypothetical protein HXY38_02655 [Chloroflexi bacterium]|nr:hypothetical protein [Chloroflexota bacterium]